jgi:hypothetical protein
MHHFACAQFTVQAHLFFHLTVKRFTAGEEFT